MLKPLIPSDERRFKFCVTQTVTATVVVKAADEKEAMFQAVATPQELWAKELGELQVERVP